MFAELKWHFIKLFSFESQQFHACIWVWYLDPSEQNGKSKRAAIISSLVIFCINSSLNESVHYIYLWHTTCRSSRQWPWICVKRKIQDKGINEIEKKSTVSSSLIKKHFQDKTKWYSDIICIYAWWSHWQLLSVPALLLNNFEITQGFLNHFMKSDGLARVEGKKEDCPPVEGFSSNQISD